MNVKRVVGDFFEREVMCLFDLSRADIEDKGKVPDLVSRTRSFFVEVKASSYNNGGVVKQSQLFRFDSEIETRRFYAFAYHSITRNMEKRYKTESKLRKNLDLRSLYIFPFSIVRAYLQKTHKKGSKKQPLYVQIDESKARKIFEGDELIWSYLGLNIEDYERVKLHERVRLITRGDALQKEIIDAFCFERI